MLYGIGVNDANYYVIRTEKVNGKKKIVWECPYYRKWRAMFDRCYNKIYQEKQPTYKGCYVCDEWHSFSNFKGWMEKQNWVGMHLDKDILVEGNKVYSPDTCVLVSRKVNNFLTDRKNDRGGYPLGVHLNNGKLRAVCSNPKTGKREHLGYFITEEDAYLAWLSRKNELAHELSEEQHDPRVAEALKNRYKI